MGGRPRRGGKKAAAPRLWASDARHQSGKAPSWEWAARAADMPKLPSPPNSGRPGALVYRPNAGWPNGKALETAAMLKCWSLMVRNSCPQVVRGEPREAGLGARLHLEAGAGGGAWAGAGGGEEPAEEEEEEEDEATCREVGADDGEASRSADSISRAGVSSVLTHHGP